MLITRTSMVSGKVRTLDIDVTAAQYESWEKGELIQNAMPQLSADDREFIMTGITANEWDDTFKEDD